MKHFDLLKNLSIYFIVVFSSICCSQQQSSKQSDPLKPGVRFPKIELYLHSGKKVTNEYFKDHVVILDFWASWCHACVSAMPLMHKLQEKYSDKKFKIIGINVGDSPKDWAENLKDIKFLFNSRGEVEFNHDVAINKDEINDNLAAKLGLVGIPQFVILDKTGKVEIILPGYSKKRGKQITEIVEQLLAK